MTPRVTIKKERITIFGAIQDDPAEVTGQAWLAAMDLDGFAYKVQDITALEGTDFMKLFLTFTKENLLRLYHTAQILGPEEITIDILDGFFHTFLEEQFQVLLPLYREWQASVAQQEAARRLNAEYPPRPTVAR